MKRLDDVYRQVGAAAKFNTSSDGSITIKDNRTGKSYDISVKDNTVKSTDLKQVKSSDGSIMRLYDPGYMNTCVCTSRISYIDGDKGILRYRGYPIEELARRSSMEEIAFLLWYGNLPTSHQLDIFGKRLCANALLHEEAKDIIRRHRADAHPMGIYISVLSCLGTLNSEANPCLAGQQVYKDQTLRNKHMMRILGSAVSISSMILRRRAGKPFIEPRPEFSFAENFLYMLDGPSCPIDPYRPHPKLVRAIDILFILHAEHELNCSTAAVRHLASSNVDVYTAVAAAVGALYGPRHGGANEAVVRMLRKIGDVKNVAPFVEKVKKRQETLMGFGHRVYKNYDPRAKLVRKVAEDVFEVVGREPMIDVAMALEKEALNDDFFVSRKLYPNVDFYSGLIYRALGFPTAFFPVLFVVPRIAGWLAHWNEFIDDPENRIIRPFQVYKGPDKRPYVDIKRRRKDVSDEELIESVDATERRAIA